MTQRQPGKPGWYWFKSYRSEVEGEVVCVIANDIALRAGDDVTSDPRNWNGTWEGPLELPAWAQGKISRFQGGGEHETGPGAG